MPDPDGPPPGSTDPRLKPVAPAPRSNPPNINAGKEKQPPAGGPPGFNDFLEWMRSQGTPAPPAPDQRSLIPKEQKKFQRRDAEVKSDKAVTPVIPILPADEVSPVAAESTPAAAPVTASPPTPATRPAAEAQPAQAIPGTSAEQPNRVRRGQQTVTKRNSWIGLMVQAVALALIVASFFLGRASVSKVAVAPAAAPAAPEIKTNDGKTTTIVLSNANAVLIDQAMASEQASNFKEATTALEKVKASGERVHGLAFQLAQLAVFANENTRAVPLLNEALAEGEDLGEAYNLRATLASRRGMFRDAGVNDYETATRLEPFEARSFFYWGSALRRAGKSQEAITHIRQALDRLREPVLESYYKLALRMTQIEIGQEKEFADELARQVALPYPNMDWLFTAAALALRDGKYDAAAAYLDRAEQCGDPSGFALRLQDFYFAQYSSRKELNRFFVKALPPKPGRAAVAPPEDAKPTPEGTAIPSVGLDVPTLPPPASPGATVNR